MTRVLLVEPYRDTTSHLFTPKGWEVDIVTPEEDVDIGSYDLVCLAGDMSDVDPALYNQSVSHHVGCIDEQHDAYVMDVIHAACIHKVPIVGICKGAQLVCVAAGGQLHQHIQGHQMGDHVIITHTGSEISTRGDHHQAMSIPQDVDCDVLATAPDGLPEVVFFPTVGVGALAVQWHPEWMDATSVGVQYFFGLLEDFLGCGRESTPTSEAVA